MKLQVSFVEKGGEGSGHWGHAGRPGQVGGSASGGGGDKLGYGLIKKDVFRYGKAMWAPNGDFITNRENEYHTNTCARIIKNNLEEYSDKDVKTADKVIEGDWAEWAPTEQAVMKKGYVAIERDFMGNVTIVASSGKRHPTVTEFNKLFRRVKRSVMGGQIDVKGARRVAIHYDASFYVIPYDQIDTIAGFTIDQFGKPIPHMKELEQVMKGGPGSGHHGHSGRPGRLGGSLPGIGQRVWQGKRQEPTKTRLSRLVVGERGEAIASRALSDMYSAEFISLNEGINNAPLDLGGDHRAVEVKTGLVTNTSKALHWRATIGQPGKAEADLIRLMTPEQKREHNSYKQIQIMRRKYDMLAAMSDLSGVDIEPVTIGIIMSEDGSRGDVYEIPDFHLRLSWKDFAIDKYYVGTYDYS